MTVPSVHGWPPRTTGRSVGKEPEARALSVSRKDRGAILLRFETNDDFERLLEVLRR